MKKLLAFIFVMCVFNACSDSDSANDGDNGDDDPQGTQIYDAPLVRSYVTYTSQNSVSLNGFIDHSNFAFPESDSFKRGFIFRAGDQNDPSNDQVFELEGEVDYYNGFYYFDYAIDGLQPSTTYYYTAYTRNGDSEKMDWEEFTTSEISCSYTQNNYYSIDGVWKNANVEVIDPQCCVDGNVGFRFGNWPDIYEINFNEIDNGYPITGQYFGEDYEFDISYIQRELVRSTNQVLIGSRSTPETELFVENDGVIITLIFCNTVLRDGTVLNGKVSADIL
ncbi:hypothetical protein WNY78_09685 [Psychroserpens sp. AS72]|uniref:hypothetical protein n=1 Tax=Psychroserpens sp. AS72 TaxID=3135775 RepID=UPI00316E8291